MHSFCQAVEWHPDCTFFVVPEKIEPRSIKEFAGLAIGAMLGALLCPILFHTLNGLIVLAGAVVGAMIGYAVVAMMTRPRES
jgi:hypothetical protein